MRYLLKCRSRPLAVYNNELFEKSKWHVFDDRQCITRRRVEWTAGRWLWSSDRTCQGKTRLNARRLYKDKAAEICPPWNSRWPQRTSWNRSLPSTAGELAPGTTLCLKNIPRWSAYNNYNYLIFITFAKEVMFLPDFVLLSVCVSAR